MVFNEDFLGKASDRVKKAFLEDGVPPTQEVQKIADEHDLTIEQVRRVCEESNKSIKLATKAEDPQFEFPVADADIILEDISRKVALSKEASAPTPTKEEIFGYGGIEGEARMSKLATSFISDDAPDRYNMNSTNRAIYDHLKIAIRGIEEQMEVKSEQINKTAGEILDLLYKEATESSSLNRSYSILMKCATTPEARNRIYDVYSFASDRLNSIGRRPLVLDNLAIDKTAAVVSAADPLFRAMNSYITMRAEHDKLAAKKDIFAERMPRALRNTLED